MTRTNRWLMLMACLSGVPAGEPAPEYYWQNGRPVALHWSTQSVLVTRTDHLAGATWKATAGKRSFALTAPPNTTMDGLAVEARAIAKATGRPALITVHTGGTPFWIADRILVKVRPGSDIQALAAQHGLQVVQALAVSSWYELADPDGWAGSAVQIANALVEQGLVQEAMPMIWQELVAYGNPWEDPRYGQQWHLENTGQVPPASTIDASKTTATVDPTSWSSYPFRADVRARQAWDTTLGQSINISVVDSGIQIDHPDLLANMAWIKDGKPYGFDAVDQDDDPSPTDTGFYGAEDHGTAVSGVAVARGGNGLGLSGAAPLAGLVPVRLLGGDGPSTDAERAGAILVGANRPDQAGQVSICNNSWGFGDNSYVTDSQVFMDAIRQGATVGRNGRGIVYLWASGNGDATRTEDNASWEDKLNSPYVMAIGGCAADGRKVYYAETGANLFLNTPTMYVRDGEMYGIATTDRTGSAGYIAGDYTPNYGPASFSGTSSACPLASGCVALILSANPNLTWRDVHHILALTCVPNTFPGDDPRTPDVIENGDFQRFNSRPTGRVWRRNAAQYFFNNEYGFGLLNAAAAVAAAKTWDNVPAMATISKPGLNLPGMPTGAVLIPDGGLSSDDTDSATGAVKRITVSASDLANGLTGMRVERLLITLDINHPERNELQFQVVHKDANDQETARCLVDNRPYDNQDGEGIDNRTFCFNGFWGEPAEGTWELTVFDNRAETPIPVYGALIRADFQILGYVMPETPVIERIDLDYRTNKVVVRGSGFVAQHSQVLWNGAGRPTQYLTDPVTGAGYLEATLPNDPAASTAILAISNPGVKTRASEGRIGKATTPTITVPVIADLADHSVNEDAAPISDVLTVAGVSPGSLLATSSNQALVADQGITIASGQVTARLLANQFGSTWIQLTGMIEANAIPVTFVNRFQIQVASVPNDPAYAHRGTLIAIPNIPVAMQVDGGDPDPETEQVTFELIAPLPTKGTATLDPATGRLVYTARTGSSGQDSFDYRVTSSDGTAANSTIAVTIVNIGGTNAPQIISEGPESVTMGSDWQYTVVVDAPAGSVLSFALIGSAPASTTLTPLPDGRSAELRWPVRGGEGSHINQGVVVTDQAGRADAQILKVLVLPGGNG